jgi:hypothetical protein
MLDLIPSLLLNFEALGQAKEDFSLQQAEIIKYFHPAKNLVF